VARRHPGSKCGFICKLTAGGAALSREQLACPVSWPRGGARPRDPDQRLGPDQRRSPTGGGRSHGPDRWRDLAEELNLRAPTGGATPRRSSDANRGARRVWPPLASLPSICAGLVRLQGGWTRQSSRADRMKLRVIWRGKILLRLSFCWFFYFLQMEFDLERPLELL
jgi:hypothetical protein